MASSDGICGDPVTLLYGAKSNDHKFFGHSQPHSEIGKETMCVNKIRFRVALDMS